MDNTALDLGAIKANHGAARREISRLCLSQGKTWTISIPVRGDDSDITLMNPLRDVTSLLAEVEQLRRELRDEQVRRDEWEKMYNRLIAGTEAERALQEERQLRRETEQCYRAALTMARHRGDRLEKAEPLAALVTPRLAALLEQLAGYAYSKGLHWDQRRKGWAAENAEQCHRDSETGRDLAARIREALENTE